MHGQLVHCANCSLRISFTAPWSTCATATVLPPLLHPCASALCCVLLGSKLPTLAVRLFAHVVVRLLNSHALRYVCSTHTRLDMRETW